MLRWTIVCTRISCMSRWAHVAFFSVTSWRTVHGRESLFTHRSSQSLMILVLMRLRETWNYNQPVGQGGHDDHHPQWFLWDLPFQKHLGFHCSLLIDIHKVEWPSQTFVLASYSTLWINSFISWHTSFSTISFWTDRSCLSTLTFLTSLSIPAIRSRTTLWSTFTRRTFFSLLQ